MPTLPSQVFIRLVPQIAPDPGTLQAEADLIREEREIEDDMAGRFVHVMTITALKSADDVTIVLVDIRDEATGIIHHRYQVLVQNVNSAMPTPFVPKELVFAAADEIAKAYHSAWQHNGDSFALMRHLGCEALTTTQWVLTQKWEQQQRAKLVGLKIADFKLLLDNTVVPIYANEDLSLWESALDGISDEG